MSGGVVPIDVVFEGELVRPPRGDRPFVDTDKVISANTVHPHASTSANASPTGCKRLGKRGEARGTCIKVVPTPPHSAMHGSVPYDSICDTEAHHTNTHSCAKLIATLQHPHHTPHTTHHTHTHPHTGLQPRPARESGATDTPQRTNTLAVEMLVRPIQHHADPHVVGKERQDAAIHKANIEMKRLGTA